MASVLISHVVFVVCCFVALVNFVPSQLTEVTAVTAMPDNLMNVIAAIGYEIRPTTDIASGAGNFCFSMPLSGSRSIRQAQGYSGIRYKDGLAMTYKGTELFNADANDKVIRELYCNLKCELPQ
jgi:hypothetical protein